MEISTTFEVRPSYAVAIPTQLQQLLMNLCTNAAQAMSSSGGELRIELTETRIQFSDMSRWPELNPGIYCKIRVVDTGVGMKQALLDRIFDPYFTTRRHEGGRGLGLAVVHGIVKRHAGAIVVSSEYGRGSTFDVYLPRHDAGEESNSAEVLEPSQTRRSHILVVDDEKALLDSLRQRLERMGHEVTAKSSSIEALEVFRKNPQKFDLVITDMVMPKMSGEDLTAALLSLRPNVRIILCTGFSEKVDPEKARAMGLQELLMKPVLSSALSAAINRALTLAPEP